MKTVLKMQDISKIYHVGEQDCIALHHIDLEIYEGEMVVVLGPSGSGKSTLLNLIGAIDTPSTGSVKVEGVDISNLKENELSEYRAQHIGFIFQFYNLIPTLSAYENVALNKELVSDYVDPQKALEMVGLAQRSNHFPPQLSGGEQQRASIARAIAKKPTILLCDEPTGALDTQTGQEILSLLQNMSKEQNKTVIMVTHNSDFAALADRVVYLRDGVIEKIITNTIRKNANEVSW
ncbi:MAG: ABC transporter ATP-binding protein [Breznakia sp.]